MTTIATIDATSESATTPATDAVVAALRSELTGPVLTPGDDGYDASRQLWNGMIDARPAVIARCATSADVQAVVSHAASERLLIAVRGGGHNVAGTATHDGAIVIDLSDMNTVSVDPFIRRAFAGGGATWADVDAATQPHGLATPGGVVSETGIGGLTLGGGIGWLRRKHGLTCDNLVAADLVTADGAIHRIDATTDPELLWGLRGGGGNFGVVTCFEYDLHPVGPEVFAAIVGYPAARIPEVLQFYRDFTTDLADEVTSFVICGTVPDDGDYPHEAWGRHFVLIVAIAATDPDDGERLVQPVRDLHDPLVDLSGAMAYTDVQQLFDADYPDGMRYYWKSLHVADLGDDVIDRCAHWSAVRPTPLSTLDIWHLAGAMARVAPDATAFGDRSDPYLLGIEANWQHHADDDANLAWARGCLNDFRPVSTGREYLNFPGHLEDAERTLRRAHGDDNYRRLAKLKQRVDPDNLFRLHQNITPTEASR
jgi:FAD/FMN-containing dehydrogenase